MWLPDLVEVLNNVNEVERREGLGLLPQAGRWVGRSRPLTPEEAWLDLQT